MPINNKINLKNLPTLVPHNIDWAVYFNNENPVDVEIGCGRTHFLFDRAINFPHRNIVGMEWKYEFIERANNKIARDGFFNVAALHGNAWFLLPLLFAPGSINEIFINFPDPWWKLRHKKRLVINEVFLDALAERTKPNGSILLQTDVAQLFSYYETLINRHQAFKHDATLSAADIVSCTHATTHREKKCVLQGLSIYRGLFRKMTP